MTYEKMPDLSLAQTGEKGRKKPLPVWVIYLLPSLLIFALFTIYPFLKTVVTSFFATSTTGEMTKFVGLQNYIDLFTNANYLQSLGTTFLYTLLTVPLTVILSLLLAVLSAQDRPGMGVFRTIFSSTMGISVAAGSVFWNLLFHPTAGLLNQVVQWMGGKPIGWLTDTHYAIFAISAVSIWMNLGFSYLVLMGGLKNIDDSHYESVEIVGGGFFYRLRKVTIPLISPSLFFVFTTSLINAFQSFGLIDMLTSGGPNNTTNLMVYKLYQDAFVNFRFGSASAQGIILFLLILLISQLQTKLTERLVTYQ
ncbi:MAG TPA: sugar ABC transporter permease [Candidatus Acutalibacter pullistercoris]|uniref:Sugar ABC transporter permease n=1 Tax=Candidatus Acutalibacter pullistercoris TaxID=2838418 RepID=A0A9D2BZ64_9FIRM|nr:sugar ABC transporter permease [Candidatus Acutalibacter pullistercoris]